jgi:hypothetical protein
MALRRPLLLFLALLGVLAVASAGGGDRVAADDANPPLAVRGRLPMLSRDVLPDVRVESIVFTQALEFGAGFHYRIRDDGLAPVDLSRFTLQVWFSADTTLDKDRDKQGAILSLTPILRTGETFEGEANASSPDADTGAYPYLIVEVDSAGAVVEDSLTNNVGVARRPPSGLLTGVTIAWDLAGKEAVVDWTFNGDAKGVPDLGFRVTIPGVGTFDLPPGTRSLGSPFSAFSESKPCNAQVAVLNSDGYYWPAVSTNSLCGSP